MRRLSSNLRKKGNKCVKEGDAGKIQLEPDKGIAFNCQDCQGKHFSRETDRPNSAYQVWQSVKVNRCEFDLFVLVREDIAFLLCVSRVRNFCIEVSECLGSKLFYRLAAASL